MIISDLIKMVILTFVEESHQILRIRNKTRRNLRKKGDIHINFYLSYQKIISTSYNYL